MVDDQAYGAELDDDDTVEANEQDDMPRPSRVSNPMFDFNLEASPPVAKKQPPEAVAAQPKRHKRSESRSKSKSKHNETHDSKSSKKDKKKKKSKKSKREEE